MASQDLAKMPEQQQQQQQSEGSVSHAIELHITEPGTERIERRELSKEVNGKRKRVVFRTAPPRGSIMKRRAIRRNATLSIREMRHGRPVKQNIGYLMMPKAPKSDKEDHKKKEKPKPTQTTSTDDNHRCNGFGSASNDPSHELAQMVAAHAGRKEVQEEDFEVLRKVYSHYERIAEIWEHLKI